MSAIGYVRLVSADASTSEWVAARFELDADGRTISALRDVWATAPPGGWRPGHLEIALGGHTYICSLTVSKRVRGPRDITLRNVSIELRGRA